jgi:hypothetical protein
MEEQSANRTVQSPLVHGAPSTSRAVFTLTAIHARKRQLEGGRGSGRSREFIDLDGREMAEREPPHQPRQPDERGHAEGNLGFDIVVVKRATVTIAPFDKDGFSGAWRMRFTVLRAQDLPSRNRNATQSAIGLFD